MKIPEPPRTTIDAAPWDAYWRAVLASKWRAMDTLPIASQRFVDAAIRLRARGARRFLVVGNGVDQLPKLLAGVGLDVVALDLSPLAIAASERLGVDFDFVVARAGDRIERTGSLRYVVGDALNPAVEPGPFDVVRASRFVHLFDDEAAVVAALRRRLAPGGTLSIA